MYASPTEYFESAVAHLAKAAELRKFALMSTGETRVWAWEEAHRKVRAARTAMKFCGNAVRYFENPPPAAWVNGF